MAKKSLEERIAQLDAQKKTLIARHAKEERAKDTRRKILLGALLIDKMENGTDDLSRQLREWTRRELPGFLTRNADRELFADLLNRQIPEPQPNIHQPG